MLLLNRPVVVSWLLPLRTTSVRELMYSRQRLKCSNTRKQFFYVFKAARCGDFIGNIKWSPKHSSTNSIIHHFGWVLIFTMNHAYSYAIVTWGFKLTRAFLTLQMAAYMKERWRSTFSLFQLSLVGWVLWHINLYRLYNAKSSEYIYDWLVGWVLWHINLYRLYNAKSS